MINLQNLTFTYDGKINILNNLNYHFKDGEKYIILGHNGIGKTTLIKLILGLLRPATGMIETDQINQRSYLPDHNGLYDDLSILDNVIFRLSLYGEKYTDKKMVLDDLLKKYRLYEKKNECVKNLSLGMKKKVALICTFIVQADAYILDEPSGGIDMDSKAEIIRMINDITLKHRIIICITHDEKLINAIHAKTVMLKEGILYDVSV